MVDRIESIPKNAQKAIHQYQKSKSIEKSENFNTMYNEIQKIKLKYIEESKIKDKYIGVVSYLGKNYKIEFEKLILNNIEDKTKWWNGLYVMVVKKNEHI